MDKITLSPICTDCKYCMQSWHFDYALREEYASCALAVFPHQQSNGKPGFASLFLRYRCKGRLFVKQENGPTRSWRYLKALTGPLVIYYLTIYAGIAVSLDDAPWTVYMYFAFIVAAVAWPALLMAYVYSKRVQSEFYYKDPNTIDAIVKQHVE